MSQCADNQLIAVMVARWNNHKLTMTMIRDILMYMDKTYCEIKSKMPSYDLGIARFKVIVAMNSHVLGRLRTELLSNIKREREHEHIDQSLMRNCLRMLVDLDGPSAAHQHHRSSSSSLNHGSGSGADKGGGGGRDLLYDAEFEVDFIRETREFYGKESAIYITENSVGEYLVKVEQRLSEEKERADSYIPKRYTRDFVMKTVEHELLGRFQQQLIDNKDSGTMHMFRKHRVADLKRMYRLFERVDLKNTLLQKVWCVVFGGLVLWRGFMLNGGVMV